MMFSRCLSKFGFATFFVGFLTFAGCGSVDSGRKIYSQILTAPSELTAEITNSTELTLTWNDNSETEVSYRIERAVGDGDFAEIETTDSDAVSFDDTEIVKNQVYTYRVRAASETGFSEFSNEESVDTAVPAAPSELSATPKNSDPLRIELSWKDNADNEMSYSIKRRPEGIPDGTNYALIEDDLPPNTISYTDENESFELGDGYCYRIFATNRFGPSEESDEICTALAPPSPPDSLAAAAVSTTEIQLTWEDLSNNEAGFNIQSAPPGSPPSVYRGVGTADSNAESFLLDGLDPETGYDLRITAFNDFGDSEYIYVTGVWTQ